MTLNICVLASGSTGNASAIWNDSTGILIDCGCPRSYIEGACARVGIDLSVFKGIVVSHGHQDHINGSSLSFAREYRIPIYIHEATYKRVSLRSDCSRISRLKEASLIVHHKSGRFSVGDFEIMPFPTFHKGTYAGKTFGFVVSSGGYRIGFLTDTGKTDECMFDHLAGCHAIILEANHDPEMVEMSDRPWFNKEWILSDYGHLSNCASGKAIVEIRKRSLWADNLRHVFVAHVSRDHNTIERACEQILETLNEYDAGAVTLVPTYHRRESAVVSIT